MVCNLLSDWHRIAKVDNVAQLEVGPMEWEKQGQVSCRSLSS
jgi:hypothetical protein